jgi:tetratricopeptide (TPR) repeat protein
LIMSMLGASLEIGRVDLQSEVYQALGSYLFITQRQPNAIKALEVALDYAGHWGREDLALLARAEHFNIESTAIELAEAELGARHLIAEARHMRYTYVEGRVYVSLMRAYQARMLPDQIFEAAQQALVIFIHLEIWGLAIQALNGMIGSLQVYEGRSTCYREILLAWLDRLTQRSVHPWFRVTSDQLYAAECYRMGDYHQARKYALRAWVGHRAVTGMARETGRIMHFMGLIQTKRRRWHLAERYLIRAGRFYREAGEKVPLIHTYHALAFIPYEQGDFERALPLLEDTLHRAQELPDQLVREALCQVIGDDLDNTRRQMERCRRETASQ